MSRRLNRVRIFWQNHNETLTSFESSMESWFDENPDIDIAERLQSICPGGYLVVTIFYKIKEKGC